MLIFLKIFIKTKQEYRKRAFSCYGHALSIIVPLIPSCPPNKKTDYFTIAFPSSLILKNLSSVPVCNTFICLMAKFNLIFFLSYFLVKVARRKSTYLQRIFHVFSFKYYFKMESSSFLLRQLIKGWPHRLAAAHKPHHKADRNCQGQGCSFPAHTFTLPN